ncbi:MATE family efflux transporter [Bacteroides thetaiotaomicron]|uniref:Multidrug-efflux transporter n=1 Tax=Bacteroides thetaiotaomicron TaxID=818 RepID=A0AAP3WH84_BACT4|nr:MATE family efflux transporter [Bacteroides thetaiotaomicron]MDC2222811.1 MATE family efflux transporter [Bacteroides thetaiotaomicron]MDC2228387.1 MATE family efflux transporter [Bacteroides thetaiotaomicron]MDC2238114.1 MATE family efflux transporter [Bacteroides thetaiotaomicron]
MNYNSYKNIGITTTPILLSLVSQNLLNVVDTIFVGHIGELELGVAVIASMFYLCVYTVGLGYSIGVQTLIAKSNGKNNDTLINTIFYNGIILSIICSLTFYMITILLGEITIDVFIKSPAIKQLALSYIDYRIIGILFTFPALIFRAMYIAINRNNVIMHNAIITTICNIFLNYILIYGNWGFPALGFLGVAVASVISELIGLLHYFQYTNKNYILFSTYRLTRMNTQICKRILSISSGTMLQNFLNMCTWFYFFIAIEHLDERSLSISNIVRSLSTLLFIPITAFAYTVSSYISNLSGSRNYQLILPVASKICIFCLAIVVPSVLIIFIQPSLIISIYTQNIELINETIPSLLIYSLCSIIAVPASVMLNITIGLGHTKIASLIQLITSFFYVGYIYYFIFYLKIDVSLAWLCEYIYWLCILICSIIYFNCYIKKKYFPLSHNTII